MDDHHIYTQEFLLALGCTGSHLNLGCLRSVDNVVSVILICHVGSGLVLVQSLLSVFVLGSNHKLLEVGG